MVKLDWTGKIFGRLSVLAEVPERRQGAVMCSCLCVCGNETVVSRGSLKCGGVTSCGCAFTDALTTHGDSGSYEYDTWCRLKNRCHNPNTPRFKDYGARGIEVCERWKSDYPAFLSDVGRKPEWADSLERIDNDKGYSPDNCKWATRTEQARNTRVSRTLTFRGREKTMAEWAEWTGLVRETIRDRIDKLGWNVERALTTNTRRFVTKISLSIRYA